MENVKKFALASAILPVVSFAGGDAFKVLLKKLEEEGVLSEEEVKEVENGIR